MLIAGGLVGAALLLVSTLKSPVIFGLRDDIRHAIPHQAVPEGVASLSAEACGVCHREIYDVDTVLAETRRLEEITRGAKRLLVSAAYDGLEIGL